MTGNLEGKDALGFMYLAMFDAATHQVQIASHAQRQV
jgi:hypothetical protein